MKNNILVLLFLMFLCFAAQAQAQTTVTKVIRLEVDEKEVKRDYKVTFYTADKIFQAEVTDDGFIVPDELKNEKHLGVVITFGTYKLDFSNIHISKFDADWVIGVDEKPYSRENVTRKQARKAKSVYYIEFSGGNSSGTKTVVIIF